MRSQLPKKRPIKTIIGFTIGLVVFVLFSFFHTQVFRALSWVTSAQRLSSDSEYALLSREILASRLEASERELAAIKYQSILYALIAEENQKLKIALGLPQETVVEFGTVVSHPPKTHYDTLLVSLSQNHEVRVGDTAVVEGIALGNVSRIEGTHALVTFFSTPGSTRDARVGDPNAFVTMRGNGGGSFSFELPDEVALESGDIVTTATNRILPIAIVEGVVVHPERTTKSVFARTPIAFSDLFVISFIRNTVIPEDL